MLKSKKSQVVTFDLVVGVIVFMIFISMFIVLAFTIPKKSWPFDFEIEYIFENLEFNLKKEYENTGYNVNFYQEYRINMTKLDYFTNNYVTKNIDNFVISNVSGTHGIGLSKYLYDSCIYFTDNNGLNIDLDFDTSNNAETTSIGFLNKTGISCNNSFQNFKNPCEGYSQAISLMKPVLFDLNDPTKNRIIQMNILLCKL
jgi:hypothetical protein